MNKLNIIMLITALGLVMAGCSDDDDSAGADADGLAVFVVNTGSGDLDIEMEGSVQVNFCYDGEGCTTSSGSSFVTIFEGGRWDIDISNTSKKAVGVQVQFEVTGGQGYAEVVRGDSYMDDGWHEFDEVNVIFTSNGFSEGDVVSFTAGKVD